MSEIWRCSRGSHGNPPARMSAVEELRTLRSLHSTKVKVAANKLTEQITKRNDRMARKYHNDVHKNYKDFETAHVQYLQRAKKEFEDAVEVLVFDAVSKAVETADEQFETFLGEQEMRAERQALEDAAKKKVEDQRKKQVSRARSFKSEVEAIVQDVGALKAQVQDESSTINPQALKVEMAYLEGRFKTALETYREYNEYSEEDDAEQRGTHRCKNKM